MPYHLTWMFLVRASMSVITNTIETYVVVGSFCGMNHVYMHAFGPVTARGSTGAV